jgi:O-succinylbenzoic acid--CoA ligase
MLRLPPPSGTVLRVTRLVPLDLPGGPTYVEAILRAWDDGDVVLPLDPRSPAAHREAVLSAAGEASLQPGDAVVMATSGTTGEPRLIVHTHDGIEAAARMSAAHLGSDDSAVWLACLPLWHVGGFSVITRALGSGAGLVVHDGFHAEQVEAAAEDGATHVSVVPTALARIDWRPWTRILLGGSAVPTSRPPNTVATYGMTETYGGVVYDGVALPDVDLRIGDGDGDGDGDCDGDGDGDGDSDGNPPPDLDARRLPGPPTLRGRVGAGASGRILLRTPTLGRPVEGGRLDDTDGWFHTSDLGHLDADGRLVVEGRLDDVIVSGGEKVLPEPVERRLEAHPLVGEAAVIGIDDPEWGQKVVALVVPVDTSEPPELASLREWVREVLPAPAAPRELRIVGSLPRTSLGKLVRRNLDPRR